MIELEIILLGTALGIFAGLIPGLGYFVTLMLVFPLLLNFNIEQLLIIYITIITLSIYVGSIPATLYGIPGDSSSMPVVYEFRNLKSLKQVSDAISGAAFGGFFGSLLIGLICFLALDLLEQIKYFYSTVIFLILITIASATIILTSSDKKYISALLYLFGFGLGMIGYNTHLAMPILVFNNYMYQGLPTEVVLATMFAFPNIFYYLSTYKSPKIINKTYNIWSVYFISPIKTLFFTIVGFFTGLVPGLTSILSSTLSYNLMSMKTKDPVQRIVASETGNNAGAFSMILPLLLFGLPITSSEALLLYFLNQNGFSMQAIDLTNLMTIILVNFVIINIIGLFVAWPLSKFVKYFYMINLRWIFASVLLIIFISVLYSGYISSNIEYYGWTLLFLLPFSFALKKYNMLPVIFGYLISDKLVGSLTIFHQLYF